MAAIEKPVIRSVEDEYGERCVDFICSASGRDFTFKEFRRDPEDGGRWTLITDHAGQVFATEREAVSHAMDRVPWLRNSLRARQ